MPQTNFPYQLYKAPKVHPARELSIEEKAALYDEAQAFHQREREIQIEMDRLRFEQQTIRGKHNALFERVGRGLDSKTIDLGPCHGCGFTNCICERIG